MAGNAPHVQCAVLDAPPRARRRFILNGVFRFYGRGLAANADQAVATIARVSGPIFQSFSLNLTRLTEVDAVAAVTPGVPPLPFAPLVQLSAEQCISTISDSGLVHPLCLLCRAG